MACNPEVLKNVPLFALLDEDELAVLAGQVELKKFAARQRIYKIGDPSGSAYVMVSGKIRISTIDEDHQEVVVDEASCGEIFGFASMLDQTPHQTTAIALEDSVCLDVDRNDISTLLQRKPLAGLDMMTVLSRQFHASQQLVRVRAMRNPNEVIEEQYTTGERIADTVARFGGSWAFIITFAVILMIYSAVNVLLRGAAWDPYPFILLNLFLSMLAAIQAPVIMMSQNRQDKKDRVRGELDYDVNRRSESEIQGLAGKLHLLDERLATSKIWFGASLPGARGERVADDRFAPRFSRIESDGPTPPSVRACRGRGAAGSDHEGDHQVQHWRLGSAAGCDSGFF